MSLDRVSSTIKEIGGEAESAVGDAIGDRGAQIGGRLRTAEGRSEKALADAGVAKHPLDLDGIAAEVQLDLAGEVGGDVDLGLGVAPRRRHIAD